MATFQIHEDKENYQQHAFQHVKHIYNGAQEKIITKKYVENRTTFQSLSNGVRHKAKRVKLTKRNNEDIGEITIKIKPEEDEKSFENTFWKIEEKSVVSSEKESDRDGFPLALFHNDEYRKDIWSYLTQAESEGSRVKPNYMLKQVDLSWKTRSILVDWLVSVSDEYKFCDQTVHLSVNYVDRFLSQISVTRSKFQLVGAAAMMLASKMEEYQAIDAQEWSYLTGDTFTARQVLKMEQLILRVLRFKMQPPTTYGFIQHLYAEYAMDPKTIHLAMYICELALLEGEDYLDHFPSKLAAASIALARHTLSKQKPWPEKLQNASGYTLKELSPVVQRQQKTFSDSPLKDQQAIQTKYKSEKFNRVALLKPRMLVLDELDDEE
ncbi:G2/mitotic-specific cyclin-A-like [Anoplophora glabripennis]|uniref:G2/mitotic-specific cyclin-A-like n=1 Tax=Anoplophora glabripennis TaxID=217634 RepID=UPI0008739701|nr:G2/mitotic-specific cyclin-A-like [Anoplophora glabripennis]